MTWKITHGNTIAAFMFFNNSGRPKVLDMITQRSIDAGNLFPVISRPLVIAPLTKHLGAAAAALFPTSTVLYLRLRPNSEQRVMGEMQDAVPSRSTASAEARS